MNDELKATLEWLKDCGNNDYLFETGNSKMLLDYITNLQEENEKFKNIISSVKEDFLNANSEAIDYKSRIEKAVEYIQNHQLVFELSSKKVISQWFDMFYKDILNILNGKE